VASECLWQESGQVVVVEREDEELVRVVDVVEVLVLLDGVDGLLPEGVKCDRSSVDRHEVSGALLPDDDVVVTLS